MAGHSHWAGIKHKKGKADKERSKIFSKLSKEITVAAKLGDKDPAMNPRLRSAVQAARSGIATSSKDDEPSAFKTFCRRRLKTSSPELLCSASAKACSGEPKTAKADTSVTPRKERTGRTAGLPLS